MKLLATIGLFLLNIPAYAEEAEQPMESAGTTGIVLFLLFCVVGFGLFVYYMRKNAKAEAEKKKAT